MNKRLKQRVNRRRSDLYKNLRNLTRAFTLINGYASRTASQYQPRTSLFSETAAWSKAHDLVQNTDHPSLLSPFGITPKFCRAVSIDARILYDLGSHKIKKIHSEGHFTWCNKGKKFPFYTLFILGERIKLIFDLFVQEFETLAFVKRHWKILSCNAFFFFAQKKLQQNLFCLFWDLLMTHEWVAKWILKICHSYISFLLHVRDVKFHELWTELRKTFLMLKNIRTLIIWIQG